MGVGVLVFVVVGKLGGGIVGGFCCVGLVLVVLCVGLVVIVVGGFYYDGLIDVVL